MLSQITHYERITLQHVASYGIIKTFPTFLKITDHNTR